MPSITYYAPSPCFHQACLRLKFSLSSCHSGLGLTLTCYFRRPPWRFDDLGSGLVRVGGPLGLYDRYACYLASFDTTYPSAQAGLAALEPDLHALHDHTSPSGRDTLLPYTCHADDMITLTSKDALSASKLHSGQLRREPKRVRLQSSLANTIAMMSSSRELPMPNISRISSLGQAQATLMVCLTKLTKFTQEQASAGSYAWSPVSLGTERQTFRDWLDRWETAFHAFLATTMPITPLTEQDMMLSRVLKANHLACTILASDQISSDSFGNDLKSIVRLSEFVLTPRHATDSPRDSKLSSPAPSSTPGLGVREPLLVVRSRCNDEELRARVDELLACASW